MTWPFNKNVTTKKLGRDPSNRTAQTKELRDKEGKRALDHAGKDVFFVVWVFFFFRSNCWNWKLALRTWRNSQESCCFGGHKNFHESPKQQTKSDPWAGVCGSKWHPLYRVFFLVDQIKMMRWCSNQQVVLLVVFIHTYPPYK